MNNLIVPVITIDGPSGAGKGTVSQILSEKLGWNLLDSGSLYRIVAYAILKNHINLDDLVSIEQLIKSIDITYNVTESTTDVLLDNENVTNYLDIDSLCQNHKEALFFASISHQTVPILPKRVWPHS